MNKTMLCFVLLLFGMLEMRAQQDPLFTQYLYNMQLVNPAYAGSREALTISGLTRAQWLGIEGHPESHCLTANMPLPVPRLALGVAILQDRIAKTRTQSAQLDLATRFQVGKTGSFAFGLKGSGWAFREGLSELFLKQPNDPDFVDVMGMPAIVNVGAGMYYQQPTYYIGLSVPALLETESLNPASLLGLATQRQRHYFGIVGKEYRLKDRLLLKATGFGKYTADAPFQFGVTTRFEFHDKFMVGAMLRYRSAVGLVVGFNFTEQFSFGYSFDYALGFDPSRFNRGSHEFGLRYDFLYRNSKTTRSPRYF